MKINERDKNKYKWIWYTFCFVVISIFLLTLILWKPLIGVTSTIMLMLTIFVGSVLKAYTQKETIQENNWLGIVEVEEKVLNSSQKLLRYATAVLAFLSLTTTAGGMNSFVFDSSWKAYLASFAVQSILVVFSLHLCRWFVRISMLK